MGYRLGVDLGTTYTAAAVGNGQGPSMLGLGNRALQIPSVLFLQEDGQFLIGDAAERRGYIEPARVVREFKRRMGDPVPLLVAGTPFSPQSLSARLLAWVVAAATERMGSAPAEVVLTYPANWGAYKRELLDQVITMADVGPARTCPEPQAAAIQYAARAELDTGARVAVYDLGGGTFDVCVLEKTGAGFRILGSPEGIEHLGGVDFDEAVFQHVVAGLGPAVSELDLGSAEVKAALTRLRRDCIDAKEALSADVDTVIPVSLPDHSTSVRLTRSELENLIGPSLRDTVDATARALRTANTTSEQLTAIVLVGGSSRIPLVSHLLQSNFGTPTALDTHPKHDIALGAVQYDAPGSAPETAAAPPPVDRGTAQDSRDARARHDAQVLREVLAPQPEQASAAATTELPAQTRPSGPDQTATAPIVPVPDALAPAPVPPTPAGPPPGGTPPGGEPPRPVLPVAQRPGGPWWRNRWLAVGAAAAAVLAVIGIGAAVALRDDTPDGADSPNIPTVTLSQQTPTSDPTGPAAAGAKGVYAMAVSRDGGRMYVTNRKLNTLSTVDTATRALIGRPTPVGKEPLGVGLAADGARVYVVSGSVDSVSPIDTATGRKVGEPIGVGDMPLAVAVHPDLGRAYVTNRGSNDVSVIDTVANRTIARIEVGKNPLQILLVPSRARAYVTNFGSNTVSVIDLNTNRTIGAPIKVRAEPHSLALSPDGARLFVTHISLPQVTVIDTASGKVAAQQTIRLPLSAWDITVGRDGRRLYATSYDTGEVMVVDLGSRALVGTPIKVGAKPTDITVTADGFRVYAVNSESGTISAIDVATNLVADTIPVPKQP